MALNLDDPVAVALAAAAAFERAGLEVALYEGLALATYWEPRETRDADLAVASVSVEGWSRCARGGWHPRSHRVFSRSLWRPVDRADLARRWRQARPVDLVTPRSPGYAARVMERAMRGTLDGQELRVVTPEDFILLKVLSTRDHDLVDARTVIDALHERLDHDIAGRYGSMMRSR